MPQMLFKLNICKIWFRLALASVCAFSMQCHSESDDSDSEDIHSQPVKNSGLLFGTPIRLHLYDKECQNTPEQQDQAPSYFMLSFYGQKRQSEILFSNSKVKVWELLHHKEIQAKKPLSICTRSAPPGDSIEGIALELSLMLSKMKSFYESLKHSNPIPPLTLNILPEKQVTRRFSDPNYSLNGHKTDNISWTAENSDTGVQYSISVFPQSEEAIQLNLYDRLRLWKIPFLLAHEMGHHVFYTSIVDLKLDPEYSVLDFIIADDDEFTALPDNSNYVFSQKMMELDLELVSGSKADLYDSLQVLAEAFSDLFAFYSTGYGPNKEVTCLAKNRDVKFPLFSNSQSKTLNIQTLDSLLANNISSIRSNLDDPCYIPSIYKYHRLGAIFAAGLYQLFSFESSGEELATLRRLGADRLLKWLQTIKANLSQKTALTPKSLLELGVKSAVDIISEKRKLKPEECQTLREIFPIFYSEWQASADKNYEVIKACL